MKHGVVFVCSKSFFYDYEEKKKGEKVFGVIWRLDTTCSVVIFGGDEQVLLVKLW